MFHAKILNCVNYATVEGTVYSGGIVGNAATGYEDPVTVVQDCVNYGTIGLPTSGCAGGLAGSASYVSNVSGTNSGRVYVNGRLSMSSTAILGEMTVPV